MAVQTVSISNAFIWRRVHSLMGLWLVLYLFVHLITNSQAALWIGDDGAGFVKLVNSLESLPYLQVVEAVFIGVPLLIHLVWGVKRALTAKMNSFSSNGSSPAIKESRNWAFTWQRLTSWILLFGILGHVIQMRFLNHPVSVNYDNQERFLMPLTFDEGLYTLAARLDTTLYSAKQIQELKDKILSHPVEPLPHASYSEGVKPSNYLESKDRTIVEIQNENEQKRWVERLSSYDLKENQVVSSSSTPGTAMLLMVRDIFKSPWMIVLYSVFVLAAAFHAFNGFWTSLITWGVILSYRSQKAMISIGWCGIALFSFLGLAAVWGSYWINFRT